MLYFVVAVLRYGDGTVNTIIITQASSTQSICAKCCQQGHVGSKTLFQQNRLVISLGCRLMPVVVYNGGKLECHSHASLKVAHCRHQLRFPSLLHKWFFQLH